MMGLWTDEEWAEGSQMYWESTAWEIESPVDETGSERSGSKYHETRETLWEVGGTTPQAKYYLMMISV